MVAFRPSLQAEAHFGRTSGPLWSGMVAHFHRNTHIIEPVFHTPGSVNVLRYCHQLIVQGKCHHGKNGDVEQKRTKEAYGHQ